MAFLGSLGKALGLDSEFGKGLIAGTARGFDEGFKDDIKRTKDNIDNLVALSYKGGSEEKKRYDKQTRDNQVIVDQIIANLGGAKGNQGKDVLQAADALINQFGLTVGLEKSKEASAAQLYGFSPLKAIKLMEKYNGTTPLTSSLITKKTVDPITLPDMKDLGKSARVGIMNVFTDADYVGDTVAQKANAHLKAAGVNIDDTSYMEGLTMGSGKVEIDPLIMGIKQNPADEIRRLQLFNNNLDENDPDYLQKQARINNMIDFNILQIKKANELAATGKITPFSYGDYNTLKTNIQDSLVGKYQIDAKTKVNGQYLSVGTSQQQKDIVEKAVQYYGQKIAIAFKDGIQGNQGGNKRAQLDKAISENKKIDIDSDNGTIEILNESFLSEEEVTTLETKSTAIPKVGGEKKTKDLTKSSIPSLLSTLSKVTDNRLKAYLQQSLMAKINEQRKQEGKPQLTPQEAINVINALLATYKEDVKKNTKPSRKNVG